MVFGNSAIIAIVAGVAGGVYLPRRRRSSRPLRVIYCKVDPTLFITDELRSAWYMLVPEKEWKEALP